MATELEAKLAAEQATDKQIENTLKRLESGSPALLDNLDQLDTSAQLKALQSTIPATTAEREKIKEKLLALQKVEAAKTQKAEAQIQQVLQKRKDLMASVKPEMDEINALAAQLTQKIEALKAKLKAAAPEGVALNLPTPLADRRQKSQGIPQAIYEGSVQGTQIVVVQDKANG